MSPFLFIRSRGRKLSFLELDIDQAEHIRATAVVVGLWWLIFSLPFFIFHKDKKPAIKFSGAHIVSGLNRFLSTIRNIKALPACDDFFFWLECSMRMVC